MLLTLCAGVVAKQVIVLVMSVCFYRYRQQGHSPKFEFCYVVVTCEVKLSWNSFEIISVFYFTRNHVWNWNKIISAAEGVLKSLQRQSTVGNYSWAAINLWNNLEVISGKFHVLKWNYFWRTSMKAEIILKWFYFTCKHSISYIDDSMQCFYSQDTCFYNAFTHCGCWWHYIFRFFVLPSISHVCVTRNLFI